MNQSDALTIQNVPFLSDKIPATIDESNTIWSVVAMICNNLGFKEDQKKRQIKNVQDDVVLSSGCKKLRVKYDTQVREVICIQNNYLPLWLAKISITPNMKSEQPEVVEKLVRYQLEAKDVLADYFLGNKQVQVPTADPHIPLSREELAAYMLYTERHTDVIEKMMSSFIDNQTKSAAEFMETQRQSTQNFFSAVTTVLSGFTDAVTLMMKNMNSAANVIADTSEPPKSVEPKSEEPKSPEQILQNKWLHDAYMSASMIGNKIGKDWKHVLRILYRSIKQEHNIDLISMRDEYVAKNNNEPITVFRFAAKSQDTRDLLQEQMVNMWEKLKNSGENQSISPASSVITDVPAESNGKHIPPSIRVRSVPEKISTAVKPICDRYDKKITRVLYLVYAGIEQKTGICLDNKVKEVAQKYHYASVNKGFAVTEDPNLMKAFYEVVAEMMNRGIK